MTVAKRDQVEPTQVEGLAPDAFPMVDWRFDTRNEPKQERSIATRRLILDAARTLADERGINGVTMQLVSQRAGIASGTAYQFFDDLESIYRDIFEDWYRDWWSVIMMHTSELWREDWESKLRALITASCTFLLKNADAWTVIRHVDATAEGKIAAPQMLKAQIKRSVDCWRPYFTEHGLSEEEIAFLARCSTYTARGHHIFAALANSTVAEVIEGSYQSQRALIAEYLRRAEAR